MHSTKELVILLIISSIIVGCAGLILGVNILGKNNFLCARSNTLAFDQGAATIIDRLDKMGYSSIIDNIQTPYVIKSITGTVQKINGNQVVLDVDKQYLGIDSNLDSRTIIVDANTKIYKPVDKDPNEYLQEVEKFQQNANNPGGIVPDPSQVPTNFNIGKAILSDIKVGQRIEAKASDNIYSEKNFTASEIYFY